MPSPPSYCVIIPSYNSGRWLAPTLASVLAAGVPVFLVIDGSTDQSERCIEGFFGHKTPLNVLRLPENRGKGAAVLEALGAASVAGFSHALVFDSDGQHEPRDIPAMLSLSLVHP
jgi:glycosyltransferase involved in cell wall biosynthesis